MMSICRRFMYIAGFIVFTTLAACGGGGGGGGGGGSSVPTGYEGVWEFNIVISGSAGGYTLIASVTEDASKNVIIWTGSDSASLISTANGVSWNGDLFASINDISVLLNNAAFIRDGDTISGTLNIASLIYTGTVNVTAARIIPDTIPDAATGLLVENTTTISIELSWTDNATNETGFIVRRKAQNEAEFTEVGRAGHNTMTYMDTGLAPSAQYDYEIVAYNSMGESAPVTTSVATMAEGLEAPSGLTLSASETSISLAWNDVATAEDSYSVEYCEGMARCITPTTLTLPKDSSMHTIDGLTLAVDYSIRVCAVNTLGQSCTQYQQAKTKATTPPAAPTDLVAQTPVLVGSQYEVTVTWTDNSTNEEYFLIEVSYSDLFPNATTLSFHLSSNTQTLTVPNLPAGMSGFIRVKAVNSAGESISNVVSVTTPP